MTFTEKAQELMKGCRICRDNRQFEKDKGLNVGSACDSDEAKISQMREDLYIFVKYLHMRESRYDESHEVIGEDISQTLKVLDCG